MNTQPGVLVFCMLVAGVHAASCLPVATEHWGMLTLVFLCSLWAAVRYQRGVVVCALAVLWAAAAWHSKKPPKMLLPAMSWQETTAWRVQIDAPVNRTLDAQQQLRQLTFATLQAKYVNGVWQPQTGRVRLRLQAGQNVNRHDILQVLLRLGPLPPGRNVHDTPASVLAERQHVTAWAQVMGPHAVLLRGQGFWARLDAWRARAAKRLEQDLPRSQAGLAKALALGDQAAIDPDMRQAWADAGIAHLLSVSGLHITLVAGVLYVAWYALLWLCTAAAERYSLRRLASLATLPALLLYGAVCAGSPAALRATFMAAVASMGLLMGYPYTLSNAWGLVGSALLLADPQVLYDLGFLLSFMAVAGLLWLMPLPQPKLGLWPRCRQAVGRAMLTSVCATWATLPVIAYSFNRVAWIAPWVNLVAVPIGSALATPLALAHVCVAGWSPDLATVIAQCLGPILQGLQMLAQKVADLGWAAANIPTPHWSEMLVFCGLTWLYLSWQKAPRQALACLAGLTLLAGLAASYQRWQQFVGDGTLIVRHLYVGQGDATLVTAPQGGHMLIDGGGAVLAGDLDPGQIIVAPWLRHLGIKSLDVMVLTHPHPDHLNGLIYIAEHWPVRTLWYNGRGTTWPNMQRLLLAVEASGGQVMLAANLPEQQQWQGLQVEVLHPRPPAGDLPYFAERHDNDNSVVLRLQYGARSLLLAGDIEHGTEAYLAPTLGPSDILKAPHHGSRTSSSQILLDAVQPRAVLISCGHNNFFGFPHQPVLERYAGYGTQVWRTDQDGTVTLHTDGQSWFVDAPRHLRGRLLPL